MRRVVNPSLHLEQVHLLAYCLYVPSGHNVQVDVSPLDFAPNPLLQRSESQIWSFVKSNYVMQVGQG